MSGTYYLGSTVQKSTKYGPMSLSQMNTYKTKQFRHLIKESARFRPTLPINIPGILYPQEIINFCVNSHDYPLEHPSQSTDQKDLPWCTKTTITRHSKNSACSLCTSYKLDRGRIRPTSHDENPAVALI